ncbi:Arabinogalactan endo-beta-1,4-galactanase [Pleurostoma richardsiae]|uniref:Arabinogalactan endo-beta-1,4-galactanase n=1 Tax=Pleurostoma richardsiae TaxID=41990 RepID=A0AA38RXL0_9PEZI|nr:Arabinogalactan endo-beta-1,4-galactanase [Pleurostoma richardsiae]
MFAKLAPVLALGLSVAHALTYRGVDWSSVTVEEQSGISYKTVGGVSESLEKILVANGVNTVRQRIWVNPSDGTYNLAYNVALAKRAKAVGLGVYLDLHFSDTWADPGHQAIPSGWPTDIDDLSWRLYNYTLQVSDEFQSNGLQPAIISIGNEITNGLLFPTGSKSSSVYNVARLLHSASAGIKDSTLSPKPKIMIHLDNGWNWSTQQSWYTSVLAAGPLLTSDFDIMGVSYYPFYNSAATLSSLKSSLTNMASTWGKGIVVAETDWPTYCPSPAYAFPSDTTSIPLSPDGQVTWIRDVASIVAGIQNGLGLFYWEPAWVTNANLGSSCGYCCMFASSGQAMSGVSVFSSI